MDILDRINLYLGENIKQYKPRRIKSGKKKSAASRLTGQEKVKYLKRLKQRKLKYRTDTTAKSLNKRISKKYRKSSKGKLVKKKYTMFKGK